MPGSDAAPDAPTVVLEPWNGPWDPHDPDANFKEDVAAHRHLDPLETLRGLSAHTSIPVGALARYVLARYAVSGSEGLLHLGSSTVERMWTICERAQTDGSAQARLDALDQLTAIVSWLRVPLHEPGRST